MSAILVCLLLALSLHQAACCVVILTGSPCCSAAPRPYFHVLLRAMSAILVCLLLALSLHQAACCVVILTGSPCCSAAPRPYFHVLLRAMSAILVCLLLALSLRQHVLLNLVGCSKEVVIRCSSVGGQVSKDISVNVCNIPVENIRNFSIIAHVDHGKSTLADRLLELAGVMVSGSGQQQVLDRLPVERERGITVKAQTASLVYTVDGRTYLLNLIDTPGHVDFANEVSRSLSACQGVVLLVDANEGVQAQTVANFYLASGKDLVVIPVLNKVDLKNANPERVAEQLHTLFSFDKDIILKISAKLGTGVEEMIRAIVERVPPPPVDRSAPFRSLLFDSWYDRYRGAVALVYVTEGSIRVGDKIVSVHSGKTYEVRGLGILKPHETPTDQLQAGQVGYITCNMRSTKEAYVGDTLHLKDVVVAALPGFRPARPMVFAGVYPTDQSLHQTLRVAIDKLVLNDSAVSVATESRYAPSRHGEREILRDSDNDL
ncbi:hypothetical protein PR048_028356, partial [Dryococelus australis]